MVHVVQLADTHYDHGYEAEDEAAAYSINATSNILLIMREVL